MNNFINKLNRDHYKLNEPLSKHTTVKIGGPADIWYEAPDTDDFVKTIRLAKKENVAITILGWGSNVLISDNGIRGLVIRNKGKNIKIYDKASETSSNNHRELNDEKDQLKARWQSDSLKGTFKYEFKDLDYDESDKEKVTVKMDSGVSLPYAIHYLIDRSITGLQWYARIPGTIGGAVFNNIHGGTHFFGEVIKTVRVLDLESLEEKLLTRDDLKNDYDKSRFHKSNEVILDVELELFKGDAEKAKAVALEWAKRKSIQPQNSPGCAFQNLSNEDKEKLQYPTTATGYIIEHVLKMTDFHIGDVWISRAHHNFIENKGNATAKDYLNVIREVQRRAKTEIGLEIKLETFLLGFTENETKDIYQAYD